MRMRSRPYTWPDGITFALNVTYTQANAAGGAVVCEVSPGTGGEFIILVGRAKNSGTNGIVVTLETATGGTTFGQLSAASSAAGSFTEWGVGTYTATAAAGNFSGTGYPVIISGTQALKVAQTGAGAQNDTFQVLMNVRMRYPNGIVAIHSNSTNAANVSATAGSEIFVAV